jgi:hypothetical protein
MRTTQVIPKMGTKDRNLRTAKKSTGESSKTQTYARRYHNADVNQYPAISAEGCSKGKINVQREDISVSKWFERTNTRRQYTHSGGSSL